MQRSIGPKEDMLQNKIKVLSRQRTTRAKKLGQRTVINLESGAQGISGPCSLQVPYVCACFKSFLLFALAFPLNLELLQKETPLICKIECLYNKLSLCNFSIFLQGTYHVGSCLRLPT